jgi:hypothetical protein
MPKSGAGVAQRDESTANSGGLMLTVPRGSPPQTVPFCSPPQNDGAFTKMVARVMRALHDFL